MKPRNESTNRPAAVSVGAGVGTVATEPKGCAQPPQLFSNRAFAKGQEGTGLGAQHAQGSAGRDQGTIVPVGHRPVKSPVPDCTPDQ